MMRATFSNKELVFIGRVMKPFDPLIKSQPAVYWDFLETVMRDQLEKALVTNAAREIIDSILYKMAMVKANEEIEKMLTDPTYGEIPVENTKVASYNRVTNITGKHQAIMQALRQNPEMSRREVASVLGWPINSVLPRVKELLELDLVKVTGTKYDEETERSVETLEMV